jgi:hypothetical protein
MEFHVYLGELEYCDVAVKHCLKVWFKDCVDQGDFGRCG